MDDSVKKNLIAQSLQTEQLENCAGALEAQVNTQVSLTHDLKQRSQAIRATMEAMGGNLVPSAGASLPMSEAPPSAHSLGLRTYEEITSSNISLLRDPGAFDAEFDDLFSVDDHRRIERELSQPIAREKWDKWDVVATFSGGIAGVVADFFTGGIDKQLSNWLSEIKIKSPQVSIDYQGPSFGGPYHRVLSSGHDVLRVFSALWQIKNGTFTALRQVPGGFEWVTPSTNQNGAPFDTFEGLEAFILWARHLLSDFVTPKSLPVPGMSWLMEMPNHEVRKFVIQLYQHGYNLRFLLVQALAPALVELIVRGYVFGREYQTTGAIKFPSAKRLKVTEMLLTAHALVMAINVGKVAIKCNAEGPLALRNLNIPSLVMTVRYFIPFIYKRMKLNDPVQILIRNAEALDRGYDSLLSTLKEDLERDQEFKDFLHDGKVIIVE